MDMLPEEQLDAEAAAAAEGSIQIAKRPTEQQLDPDKQMEKFSEWIKTLKWKETTWSLLKLAKF